MEEKKMTEEESLALITNMIQRARNNYHKSGTSIILWGTVVATASFVSYLQMQYHFEIGFDIWFLVVAAIIPQIILSVKAKRTRQFRSHSDIVLDTVWLTYAVTLLGVVAYQHIIPFATDELARSQGWQMIKHYMDGSKPDEPLRPFAPSVFSIYLLIFAMPTLVTGIVKQFMPMIVGACITYVLFIASCFTAFKYDMLFGTVTALACWFIPGLILRRKYLRGNQANV